MEPPGASPASDAVLDRLARLHPRRIDLSLGRIRRLLAALGHPERRLPPTIHVAGTNGKGSTIAFMRAVAEAAGLSAHAYTSPHLVRFGERILLRGRRIPEDALAEVLDECERANAGAPATFFEVTTAAAFLAFSRRPADMLLLETGLGGRLDATNAVHAPAATVITPVSIDHAGFLGGTLAEIAAEKAGILKPGVPCVLAPQPDEARAAIEARAARTGAPLLACGRDWTVARTASGIAWRGRSAAFDLPSPSLPGPHQVVNAGTAVAALLCWRADAFGRGALAAGLSAADWPARFQRLRGGRLDALLGGGRELWLDGGHNPAAGEVLAETLAELPGAAPAVLVCAMQASKDAGGFLAPLARVAGRLVAVPLPGGGMDPALLAAAARELGLAAGTANGIEAGLRAAAGAGRRLLVCGSLRLAGAVLAADGRDPA